MMKMVIHPILIAALCISVGSGAEVFSALTHFTTLIKSEAQLAAELQAYIAAEQERLLKLRHFANEVGRAVKSSQDLSPEEHIGHPTNAFLMVRRFTHDWTKLQSLLRSIPRDNKGLVALLAGMKKHFPSTADVDGTGAALLRLQETYRLNTSSMAEGMAGSKGQRLPVRDIFYLGLTAYTENKFAHAKKWLQETLRRLYAGEVDHDIPESTVVDHLSYCEYKLDNIRRAIRWTKKLLRLQPSMERAQNNLLYYLDVFRQQVKNGTAFEAAAKPAEPTHEQDVWLSERGRYQYLCRTSIPTPDYVAARQICFYTNRNRTPGLILQPAKVEVAWVRPTVLLYRDMVSDSEIERLKELATPKLKRATVHNPTTGKLEFADYRVSKSGWLGDEDDPSGVVARLNQRITDYTGLSMSTAELLQVVNYGIGGQYEPHFDHARKEEKAFDDHEGRNRIATTLFYLSNVTAGGCTVFTRAGARIAPSKGDASFWYNLLPSGEGDESTRHAGCPVLSGSKWVCNKWIHEVDQEFRQPCKLGENDYWDIHQPPEFL